MSVLDGVRHRVRVWTQRADYERQLDEEMRLHLTLDAEQHAERGAHGARRRFGNVTYLKEETRRVAGLSTFDGMLQDARHLFRSLGRSPGFAIVAILTLALGIGATTAVVSIVDHVLVNALPFRDANRLVMMMERGERGGLRTPSAPTARDWQQDPGAKEAFDGIAFVRGDGVLLSGNENTERVGAAFVGPEFFPLMGARPVIGRVLLDADHSVGAAPAAVIAYALWQRRFGGDPRIVGQRMQVDSTPVTIVGVLPRGAVYPGFASVWIAVSHYKHQDILSRRGLHVDSRTIGRLRPGVDSSRAEMLMRTIAARLAAAYPAEQRGWSATMMPLRNEVIGDVRPMLLTLASAAAAVLLLACANVANLLLARVATRTREIVVRSALGASRGRLVRQMLTESVILATLGGLLGTAIAVAAINVAKSMPPARLPRTEELMLDHRVLIVAAVATLITALVCGVWPALRATRSANIELLRASASGSMARGETRLRRALVTVQFALALMLLVGAGLLLQSFRRAAAVDVGFDPKGLLTLRLDPPAAYSKPEDTAALYARLMTAVRSVPGVSDAAVIQHFPFGTASITTSVIVDGRSTIDTGSNQIFYRSVSASYVPTMKMSVASGRWYTEDDMRSPGGSFVINETMAKRYWPGEPAVGKRITIRRSSQARADFGQPLPGVIVGVVRDVHQQRQDVAPQPEVYVPYTLETWPWTSLVIRTRVAERSIPDLRRAISAVEPSLIQNQTGTADFTSVENMISDRLEPRRFSMKLISVFAACALALAAIGMYGVIAYGVAQRTREIGVRKALGATDGMVASLVMRESLALTAIGVVLGCIGAWATSRFIQGLLFNTAVADPMTYVFTVALLGAIAMLATYVPARRATRLDPTIAMRGD
jgi:putative ABC transport system permease protein